ncbi:MAG: DNA topoisomerase (ATP-hydrolyzing) subunit A [Clostridia bacterium]|nr:DNA topoisomerase (ATP-hydrolyzing) subunit A [Clostridia bacterium]
MDQNNIKIQKITDTLEENFMPYAVSVIVSRAIPEIDGLKPSHRKLLYTMYKMGLLRGNRTKSANVVGQTMKLNPHGDQAIYETMVRMTRGNEALLLPFVDSKGNFGKQYSKDMKYAASRYTEVKLEAICKEMFRDIEKDAVEFTENYDGTMLEPVLLPSAYPNVLVNTSQGIAVGMASNLCSFNLAEVCDTAIALIKDSKADISKTLKGPDFSTGGVLLYNKEEMDAIYETGRGGFKLRAKYSVDKKKRHIEITEIPYTTTSEAIIDSIIGMVKSSKLKEVRDVRDETDLKGLKITIDIRGGTDIKRLMNKLFLKTPLQDTFNCNFNVLIEGNPMVLGIKELLAHWTTFRIGCIKRRLSFDLKKNKERLHLLLGLDRILIDIDEAIRIIRNTEREADVVPNLMQAFRIDEIQADYIAEIKLRYLNREYILKRLDEIKDLRKKIEDIEVTLKSNAKIRKIIIGELEEVRDKYGIPRKTEIRELDDVDDKSLVEQIPEYNCKVFFTRENYLKKIPLTALRTDPEQKLKDSDKLKQEISTHNKAELIMFSNKANAYKVKLHQLEESKAGEFGTYLPVFLELPEDETIVYVVVTDDFKGIMLYGFENGKFAKVPLSVYETKTNRKLLAKAYYDKSPLKYIRLMDEKESVEMAVITKDKRALIFNTDFVSVKTTRNTQGITVIKLKDNDKVSEVVPVKKARLKNADDYRPNNVPAVGKHLSKADSRRKQVTLFDLKND